VPPERVVDYMALLGDTIDTFPEQRELAKRRSGTDQEIRKCQNALDHADEVSNKLGSFAAAARASVDVQTLAEMQGRADRGQSGELELHRPTALRSRNSIVNWASVLC